MAKKIQTAITADGDTARPKKKRRDEEQISSAPSSSSSVTSTPDSTGTNAPTSATEIHRVTPKAKAGGKTSMGNTDPLTAWNRQAQSMSSFSNPGYDVWGNKLEGGTAASLSRGDFYDSKTGEKLTNEQLQQLDAYWRTHAKPGEQMPREIVQALDTFAFDSQLSKQDYMDAIDKYGREAREAGITNQEDYYKFLNERINSDLFANYKGKLSTGFNLGKAKNEAWNQAVAEAFTPVVNDVIGSVGQKIDASNEANRPMTNEEAMADILGQNIVSADPEDVAKADWARAGVDNAEDYRDVMDFYGRNLVGGTIGFARNTVNDIGYKAQGDAASQEAWNAVELLQGGDANARAEANALYEDYLNKNPGGGEDITSVYYKAKLAEFEQQHANDEVVRFANFGDNYDAQTMQMVTDLGLSKEAVQEGQNYYTIGNMLPMVAGAAVTAGALNIAGLAGASAEALADIGRIGNVLNKMALYNSASGAATEEALKAGFSLEDANAYGSAIGGIEVISESLFDGLGKVGGVAVGGNAMLDGAMKRVTEYMSSNPVAQKLALSLMGVVGEGLEEVFSEAGGWMSARLLLDGFDERSFAEMTDDAKEAFLGGVLVSMLMSSGNIINIAKGSDIPPAEIVKQAVEEAVDATAQQNPQLFRPQTNSASANQILRNPQMLAEFEATYGKLTGKSNTEKANEISRILYGEGRNAIAEQESASIPNTDDTVTQRDAATYPLYEESERAINEQRQAEETARIERERAELTERVMGMLNNMSHANANEIARYPSTRAEFTRLTGVELDGMSSREQHDAIMRAQTLDDRINSLITQRQQVEREAETMFDVFEQEQLFKEADDINDEIQRLMELKNSLQEIPNAQIQQESVGEQTYAPPVEETVQPETTTERPQQRTAPSAERTPPASDFTSLYSKYESGGISSLSNDELTAFNNIVSSPTFEGRNKPQILSDINRELTARLNGNQTASNNPGGGYTVPENGPVNRSRVVDNFINDIKEDSTPTIDPSYRTQRNVDTDRVARQRVADNDINKVISELTNTKMWDAIDVVTSNYVFKALERGVLNGTVEPKQLLDFQRMLREHGTDIGRAAQAFSIRSDVDPDEMLTKALEHVDSLNISDERKATAVKEVTDVVNNYRNAVEESKKTDGKNTDSEDYDPQPLIDFIKDISSQRNTSYIFDKSGVKLDKVLESLRGDYDYLQSIAAASITGFTSDFAPVNIGAKLKTWQSIAQLLKIPTIARNILGNATYGFADAFAMNTAGIAIDKFISSFTGKRSVSFNTRRLNDTAREARNKAMQRSMLEIALDVNVNENSSKYELGNSAGRSFKMNGNAVERVLSRFEQVMSYGLQSTDQSARGLVTGETEAKLNKLNENNPDAINEVHDVAKNLASHELFQDDNQLSRTAQRIHDVLNIAGVGGTVTKEGRKGGFGLGDLTITYAKVPTNLAMKPLQWSPASAVLGLYQTGAIIWSEKNGKPVSLQQQRNAANNFARGCGGTAMVALFTLMAKSGLTRREDDDFDVANADKTTGKKGTQWNISATLRWLSGQKAEWKDGDITTNIGFLEPLNAFMDIGYLVAQDIDDGGVTFGSLVGDYFYGSYEAMMEMPIISNLSSAVSAFRYSQSDMSDGDEAVNGWLDNMGAAAGSLAQSGITGMMPGIMTEASNAIDPYERDTRADTWLEQTGNKILLNTPFRTTLDRKIDANGNEMLDQSNGNRLMDVWNSMFAPGGLSVNKANTMLDEFERIKGETGINTFYPDYKAPANITIRGSKYELTTDEIRAYEQLANSKQTELTEAFINSDVYKNMSSEQIAEVFKDIKGFAEGLAKDEFASGREIGNYRSSYENISQLSDIAGYYAARQVFADAIGSDASYADERDYKAIEDNIGMFNSLPQDVRDYMTSSSVYGISRLDDISEALDAGLSAKDWFSAYDKYRELSNATDIKKSQAAADFATWLSADAGFNDKQVAMLRDQMPYYTQLLADTSHYDSLASTLGAEKANQYVDTMYAIEKIRGEDDVQNFQKRNEIILSGKIDAADIPAMIEEYMSKEERIDYDTFTTKGGTPEQYCAWKYINTAYGQSAEGIDNKLKQKLAWMAEYYGKGNWRGLYNAIKGTQDIKEEEIKFRDYTWQDAMADMYGNARPATSSASVPDYLAFLLSP